MYQHGELIPPSASELNKTNQYSLIQKQEKSSELDRSQSGTEKNMQSLCSETCEYVDAKAAVLKGISSAEVVTKELKERAPEVMTREDKAAVTAEDNGRERLKRHRIEVAGRVRIPDIWGQEEMLKDWIDCSTFDSSLVSTSILSAREALVQEGSRANSRGLRIENRC